MEEERGGGGGLGIGGFCELIPLVYWFGGSILRLVYEACGVLTDDDSACTSKR